MRPYGIPNYCNPAPRESIAHPHGTDHPLVRHPRRRLLYHRRHSQRRPPRRVHRPSHSCDPNCETEEVDGRVWIKAIRNIAPAEEITYDYCLYDGGDDEAICNCGAPKCRGTMYSKEEIRRRKAAAKKAALKARKATKKKRRGNGD